MSQSNSKLISSILGEFNEDIFSDYLELDSANHQKNQLQIKSVLQKHSLELDDFSEYQDLLEQPHLNKSIAIFTQDNKLIGAYGLPFNYQINLKGNRAFVLPFFDHRYSVFGQTYVLVIAEDALNLYKVGFDKLEQVRLPDEKTFAEKVMAFREETKSIQNHVAEGNQVHGQGAANQDTIKQNLKEDYLKDVAGVVKSVLKEQSKGAQLIVAAPKAPAAILRKALPEQMLSFIQLDGAYASYSEAELLSLINEELSTELTRFVQQLPESLDISASNKMHDMSFVEMLSVIQSGRIAKIIVGQLGEDLADYENPIAPQGANYIAQEVLKLGGEVEYYPDSQFEFSKSNMLFQFRY